MQNVGPLNGANLLQDYQASAPSRVSLVPGVIGSSSLAVTTNSVAAGEAFVLAERTNGEKVLVHFRSTEAVAVDTSGTTKVFVKIDQAKIDDGSANSVDGTWIASIQSAASYPASNFIPLASVTGGVITDAREEVKYYGKDFDGLVGLDKGADIASASTVDLGTATGNTVHVTGTTAITSFGSSARPGTVVNVVFDGALTLTHNATSLIIPWGSNVTTAAGDTASFVCESAGNWRCVSYVKANGTALIATTDINGLAAVTELSTNDAFIVYEDGAAANRKILQADAQTEMLKPAFGNGEDGSLSISSGTTALTATSGFVIKQYQDLTISGTATLDLRGEFNILYVNGTFTMSAGTVTANGRGAAGGAGTTNSTGAGAGTSGRNLVLTNAFLNGVGANGTTSGFGAGGAQNTFPASNAGIMRFSSGSGGGGATSGHSSVSGGAGGAGGGVIVIVAKRINITGGTISADGATGVTGGSNAGFGSSGGGGGGSGGTIVLISANFVSNAGTKTANGGGGGAGGTQNTGGAGGGGGGGYTVLGGNGSNGVTSGTAANGGNGGSNAYGTGWTGGIGSRGGGGGGGAAGLYYSASPKFS